ncbi:MAG: hypothetical protein NT083_13885 [Rhodocyclales bacterium]|nr:hypothetical protein [Rhodocyclales bacterium]
MNKAPFRRVCEMAGISPTTLYDKLDFGYHQCLAFVADRERLLVQGKALKKLYIAVDRQDYTVNWNERGDKRNVTLHAVGSADLTTGYVFGMHLNFEPNLDAELTELDAIAIGDADFAPPFREYSRLWLPHDYADSVMRSATRPSRGKKGKVADDIKAEYRRASR